MTQDWKRWEGQVVDGNFVLRQYLTGSEQHGVFLTEHAHKDAAIKLVAASATGAEKQLTRWNEAAKLSHPNLIQIYKTGRCRFDDVELLFVVAEYAEEDLAQILPHRALTPAEATDMLRPVLGTLEYLHRRGLAHGRIKPANIMAIGDRIKLSSDSIGPSGASSILEFKPGAYDAPEAAKGELSPAGDVWSLGMTLSEVVTQRVPQWDRAQQLEPVLPDTLAEPFLGIVRNCLCPNPQLRWTTAEIAARLRTPSSGTPAVASTPAKTPGVAAKPAAVPVSKPVERTAPKPVVELQKPAAQQAAAQKSTGKWYMLGALGVVSLAVVFAAPRFFNSNQNPHPQSDSIPQPQTVAEVQPTMEPPATPAATPQPSSPKPKSTPKQSAAPGVNPLDEKPSAGQRTASLSGQNSVAAAVPAATAVPQPTVKVVLNGADKAEIVRQGVPDVPRSARDTITGKIRVNVKVQVDASGKVVNAELNSPGTSQYFSTLAMQAAQRWQFAPAQAEARVWVLQFGFEKTGTEIVVSAAE